MIQPPNLRLNSLHSQAIPNNEAAENGSNGANSKLGNWGEVQRINGQLESVIEDLDKKLNCVLAKQEYEYLKGYNIYVK